MQIEVGKFYRMRDGRKAGPLEALEDVDYVFHDDEGTWTKTGAYWGDHRESPKDLVAEWTEATTAEPASDEIEWGEWGPMLSDDIAADRQMQVINGKAQWRYPVPKQPVVETVTLTGHNARGEGWSFAPFGNYHDAARITFDVIDGKPDWSTLRG